MAKLVIWVTVFMLFGSCVGIPQAKLMKECKTLPDCPIKLDMATDSVDDMYDKCENDMERKVKTFLSNEQNTNENFKQAWNKAEEYYKSEWENNPQLKKEQIMALHAYTLEDPPLYCDFNEAVRTNKSVYKTKFQYHTLHFYLTMALRTIKRKAEEHCVTVYRRTRCKFSRDVLNKQIRLGAFSSSSMGDYSDEQFGTQSCFEISTCFGASISEFSEFETESEVLVPPYEGFKVTEIKESSEDNELPCEVVYKLQSTKTTRSNLNCALFKKKHLHGFN
ncbi:erythroblast NAD(P)(+)--arginine ADP-ribosyltransferase-like [Poecilia formosa]|uniref:NAD(P)(+)--arginine ADP-ribosyltransferase n=1 Tax=Poecilia formosa TaxID=48698 RepID=A0A087XP11_POEFO|nr:PREDICTED: erythroblast NAD(P)(+)--arginine ADP-ribosyltransferase-like [Poecilia formosa]